VVAQAVAGDGGVSLFAQRIEPRAKIDDVGALACDNPLAGSARVEVVAVVQPHVRGGEDQ
jgi:hypothetical protein